MLLLLACLLAAVGSGQWAVGAAAGMGGGLGTGGGLSRGVVWAWKIVRAVDVVIIMWAAEADWGSASLHLFIAIPPI